MEPTIEEVARRAGVSTATVSRSLRGHDGVSHYGSTSAPCRRRDRLFGVTVCLPPRVRACGHRGCHLPYLDRWFFGEVLGAAEPKCSAKPVWTCCSTM